MKTPTRLTNTRLHTHILRGIVGLIVVSAAVMLWRQSQGDIIDQYRDIQEVSFLGTTSDKTPSIQAMIADTKYKHEYGLMFRGQLNWGDGMLFIFEDEQERRFWMKNTYVPLDLIFLNDNGRIVHIHEGAIPMDKKGISSIYPAKYVIEVNSGWSSQAMLTTGSSIDINTIIQ